MLTFANDISILKENKTDLEVFINKLENTFQIITI